MKVWPRDLDMRGKRVRLNDEAGTVVDIPERCERFVRCGYLCYGWGSGEALQNTAADVTTCHRDIVEIIIDPVPDNAGAEKSPLVSVSKTDNPRVREVRYKNGFLVGQLSHDGLRWQFFPKTHDGYWTRELLRAIADAMEEEGEPDKITPDNAGGRRRNQAGSQTMSVDAGGDGSQVEGEA